MGCFGFSRAGRCEEGGHIYRRWGRVVVVVWCEEVLVYNGEGGHRWSVSD
jgi:hypothetical protein